MIDRQLLEKLVENSQLLGETSWRFKDAQDFVRQQESNIRNLKSWAKRATKDLLPSKRISAQVRNAMIKERMLRINMEMRQTKKLLKRDIAYTEILNRKLSDIKNSIEVTKKKLLGRRRHCFRATGYRENS